MTTETKVRHTPGPWLFDKYEDGGPFQVFDENSDNGDIIATVDPDGIRADLDGAAEANARLIAAAPELLQNLKDLVKVWENGWKVDKDVYLHCANAAIAKAEGR